MVLPLRITRARRISKMEVDPLKKHVRSSYRDAVYTSLNIGLTESYFCAFMLALGISEVLSGLGTVIPQFIGVIFQLFSIRSFFTRFSLKKRLLLFLGFQAFSLVPLIVAGIFKLNSPFLIIGILGIYWASLLSLNPPWNRLMGHSIPKRFRIKFFSMRSQFAQFSVFLGLIIAGLLLNQAQTTRKELPLFVGIFCVGFILKSLSWYEFKKNHIDYALKPGAEERVRFRDFIKRLQNTEQGRLVSFLFLFYVTVHFSAPYFNPYMLKHLKWNYLQYMLITSISYFGRVIMFRVLQKRAKARHVNNILLFSTIGISTSPILWSLSQNFGWLAGVEFLSGCYWAGFELSTILLYYQKIEDHERTSIITYIAFLNTTGMLLGSLLGATFMRLLPPSWDHYLTLFVFSTFMRFGLLIFAPHIDFRGQIPKLISSRRVLSVFQPLGLLSRPVIEKSKKDKK